MFPFESVSFDLYWWQVCQLNWRTHTHQSDEAQKHTKWCACYLFFRFTKTKKEWKERKKENYSKEPERIITKHNNNKCGIGKVEEDISFVFRPFAGRGKRMWMLCTERQATQNSKRNEIHPEAVLPPQTTHTQTRIRVKMLWNDMLCCERVRESEK